ncbi:MAG TPA: DUF5915 domain-containing protein, partial [Candidatus Thermoplasmatota archaeon]|nr:DUF5915 domain-containing protein [Candidatus Thermoplasmatota archaeon]
ADFPGGSVYVDTEVSKELEAEGAARDLTRRVQEMRKLLGLHMSDAIRVEVAAPPEFAALVAPHVGGVAEATRAASGLAFVEKPHGELVREWDLEGTSLLVAVSRAGGPALAPTGLEPAGPRKAKPSAKAREGPVKKATKAKPAKAPVKKSVKPAKAPTKKVAKKAAKKAQRVVAKAKKAIRKAAKKVAKKAPAKKRAPKKAAKKAKTKRR